MAKLIEVKIDSLRVSLTNQQRIVVLKQVDADRLLITSDRIENKVFVPHTRVVQLRLMLVFYISATMARLVQFIKHLQEVALLLLVVKMWHSVFGMKLLN